MKDPHLPKRGGFWKGGARLAAWSRSVLIFILAVVFAMPSWAQSAVRLPQDRSVANPEGEKFTFVSDGPFGTGWDRTSELGRVYFAELLPAFFSRTIVFEEAVPGGVTLSWIFTGQRAGFTIEIGPGEIRLLQRYYDSYGLFSGNKPNASFPERIVNDQQVPYVGPLKRLTVVLDAHLSLQLWANGTLLMQQSCLFDVSRHQLKYTAPRSEHLVVSGTLLPRESGEAEITARPERRHQTILGFGGSPSIPAYASLSEEGKRQYWSLLKRYNLLIDREYPMGTALKPDFSNLEDLADASPHYYGDNFPNGEVSSFAYNKKVLELEGKVIYEMWDLPPWATRPEADPQKKRTHAVADPENYARAMVTYCRLAKERTGRPPAIVGIQNEVEQPHDVAIEMVRVLRKRLNEAGFYTVQIHMADAPFMYQGVRRAAELREQSEVWKSIDYTAVHQYDYQDFFTDPDLYDERMAAMHKASEDKPFLATEICLNKPSLQEPSYRVAFNAGQLYHKDLTLLDAIGLLYCWLILDVEQPNFSASRSLLAPDRYHGNVPVPSSYQLRVLGAYSRHVREGMQRVETTSSNPDLLVSAFTGAKGQATMVVLNRSVKPQRLRLHWNDVAWRELERTSPYLENAIESVPDTVVVGAGEIVTVSTSKSE